jgi:hypothetical protein
MDIDIRSSLSPVDLAVDRGRGSRWSARSAARTNDLDVDKVDRMLFGGATRMVGVQVMCCLRWCEVLLVGGVPAPRLIWVRGRGPAT